MNQQPVASRPRMDDVPQDDESGLMDWGEAECKLAASRSYWISTTRPDGRPHAMPVWGAWHDGALYFGTGANTVKARNLSANPAVVVHLESADDMVVVEGTAERIAMADAPGPVDAAYREKYGMGLLDAGGDAPLFVVRPRVAFAWLEADFLNTATRWEWR